MRLAVLLALAFGGLFAMWAATGVRIMRCAMGIELADDVKLDGVGPPGAWLVSLTKAEGEAGAQYEQREFDSFL
jgi:hypothetical protein